MLSEQIVRTHNGAMRILLVIGHSSLLTMCVTNLPESWTDSTLSAQAQSSPARTITSTYARHLSLGSLCRLVQLSVTSSRVLACVNYVMHMLFCVFYR